MASQVFNAISREGKEGEEKITLSVKIADDKVVAVTARGEDGREYNVCLQFTKKGGGGGDDRRFCCCVDQATGQMVCQVVNGACPACADTDEDGDGGNH